MRIQDSVSDLISGKKINPVNKFKTEKTFFYIVTFLSFFSTTIIYFISDSPYDTGDGIVHYQIARYSWKHPNLLLYLWGKPFFTLISSPFAQFGLKGMYIFQTLNAVAISWFLYSIADKINLKYKWTIPIFVFFAPVYFAVLNSGLVEISFGTMFMFSVWLAFNKRYYASALVASIIPFVRPEAYVVMPLLTAIYIYRKKYFAIPLLAAGFVLYTIIGYIHFKDLLWIINQNYQLVGDNYAGMKGSYFHYFKIYYAIWGTAYSIPFLIGIGTILIQVYRLFQNKSKLEYIEEVFVLFLGCTAGCFVLHSLLCGMPGILNNLGMVRYMAVIIPSSALIALIGLNIIDTSAFSKITFYKPAIVVIILIFVIVSPFTQRYFPFKTNNEQHVMKQIASYIKTSLPGFKKVCFLHPTFPVFANLDPYDSNKVADLLIGNPDQLNQLPDSTLLIWDSHFMKDDGRIPLDWLTENPNFVLLKHYAYGMEKFPFEACVFIRSNNPNPVQKEVPVEILFPDGTTSY